MSLDQTIFIPVLAESLQTTTSPTPLQFFGILLGLLGLFFFVGTAVGMTVAAACRCGNSNVCHSCSYGGDGDSGCNGIDGYGGCVAHSVDGGSGSIVDDGAGGGNGGSGCQC